jgi:hypothetical protein
LERRKLVDEAYSAFSPLYIRARFHSRCLDEWLSPLFRVSEGQLAEDVLTWTESLRRRQLDTVSPTSDAIYRCAEYSYRGFHEFSWRGKEVHAFADADTDV